MLVLALFTLGNSTDAFLVLRLTEAAGAVTYVPLMWAALHVVKATVSLVGGSWSDRVGRRAVIAVGWVVYAAVYAGFAILRLPLAPWILLGTYGLYQALTEGVVYSPEGQPLTGSLLDYALPRAHDVPPLILETLEVPSPTNPLGAKGIGSVSTVPAPAAVANAVLDALASFGVRHLDTPLTAEKIWRAMHGTARQ
jgi:MFS family permease